MTDAGRGVAVNLLGIVEHPSFEAALPYSVDLDGRPFVPTGDSGVVLGVRLGDRVDAWDTDMVVPGVTLVHRDGGARAALTALSCIGNLLTVRTGPAAGAIGYVAGKRGELGRVVGAFAQRDLERLRPGDQVAVASFGQGTRAVDLPPETAMLNIDPRTLHALPARERAGSFVVDVRAVVASRLIGNGIGRPAHAWDVALCLVPGDPLRELLHLGDLVAVADLDARHNVGFRRGWCTVGVVTTGLSPRPGHGVGLTPILSGPMGVLDPVVDPAATGITEQLLGLAPDLPDVVSVVA